MAIESTASDLFLKKKKKQNFYFNTLSFDMDKYFLCKNCVLNANIAHVAHVLWLS